MLNRPEYDGLTLCGNNNLFKKNVCDKNKFIRLFFVNIKRFKLYNDVYGMDAGDAMLIKLSLILKKAFVGKTIYRVHVDKFAVVLSENEIPINIDDFGWTLESWLVEINCFRILELKEIIEIFDCVAKNKTINTQGYSLKRKLVQEYKIDSVNREKTLLSLEGLSVGDAFGECFFGLNPTERINERQTPTGIWRWTDDTHMALSVVEVLFKYGSIDRNALMTMFSNRYIHDKRLGYGAGTSQLLERVYYGEDGDTLHRQIFPGGSYGNGAAMRSAPIGAYFSGDLERTAYEARDSADITHAHIEGWGGAVAIAVAASIASQAQFPVGNEFIQSILPYLPKSLTKEGINKSLDISPTTNVEEVIQILGNGGNVSAQDTVPYCIWCAAHNLQNYEEALWKTVSGLGDRDTTCAIVGGIVALSAKTIPKKWKNHREAYPTNFLSE